MSSSIAVPHEGAARSDRSTGRIDFKAVAVSLAPFAVLSIFALIGALFFWPGGMSDDSFYYISEVRSKIFSDQHAPVLNWIWSYAWPLGFGVAWVLVLQFATFMYGGYLILRTVISRWWAVLATVVITALPQSFGLLGYIGRDTWFTSAMLLMVGLVATSWRKSGWLKIALQLAALGTAFIVLASRQNAAPAVVIPVAIIAWPYVLKVSFINRQREFLRIASVLAVGFVLTVAMMGSQVAIKNHIVSAHDHPATWLFIYDLAALSLQQDKILIPKSIMAEPTLSAIDRTFDYDWYNNMIFGKQAPVPLTFPPPPASADKIQDAWVDAVQEYPTGYLGIRWHEFKRQLSLSQKPIAVWADGIGANQWNFTVRFDTLNNQLGAYMRRFTDHSGGLVIFRAWIYLLIALISSGYLLLRHRRNQMLVSVAAIGISMWLYQVGLFFGAMGTNWRFEHSTVTSTMFLALVTTVVAVRDRRESRAAEPAATTNAELATAS